MGEWKIVPDEQPTKGEWKVAEEGPAPDEWRQTDFGFRVKPTVTHNGTQSVQREDGLVWYGPQQGNTGRPGWFDSKGLRGPDAPVKDWYSNTDPDKGIGLRDRLSNQYQEWIRRNQAQGVVKTTLQDFANAPVPVTPGGLVRMIREGLGYRAPVTGPLVNEAVDPTLGRVAQGTHDTIAAPIQLVANSVAPNTPVSHGVNNYITQERKFADERLLPSTTGEMIGQGIPFLLSGGAAAPMAPAKLLPQMAKGAVAGGFLAPVFTPEVGAKSSEDVLAPKLREGLFGAGLGAAAPVAGKVLKAGARMFSERTLPPEMAELQALADRYNVPVDAATLDPSLKKTRDVLTHIPFSGMDEQIAARREAADQAAQRLLAGLRAKVETGGGNSPSELAMKAGRANHEGDKWVGGQLYQALADLAGTKEAPRNNVIGAMREVLSENARASKPDAGLVADLETRIRRLTQNSAQAKKAGEVPMDKSFGGLKDLATEFWQEAQKYEKGTQEHRLYTRLHQAAMQDMDDFVKASKNPALESVNDLARSWWKDKVKTYSPDSQDYGAMAKALRGKDLEPEKVMDYFIKANDSGRAKYFYNGLDDNGRAAVRWGIVQDAYEKATAKGNKPFSPADFATYMKNHQEATGVFFKGQDKWEIDGFTKLMRAIEEAGGANSVAHTGKSAIFPMIAGSQGTSLLATGGALVSGHPGVAAGALTSATLPTLLGKAGTKLFTTPAGKRFLLAVSDLPVGSKAFNTLIERDLPKILGAEAKNITPLRTAQPMPLPAAAQTENQDRIAQQ